MPSGIVYMILPHRASAFVKIGFTKNTFKRLVARYSTYYPAPVFYAYSTDAPRTHEKQLHKTLRDYRIKRELFRSKCMKGFFDTCCSLSLQLHHHSCCPWFGTHQKFSLKNK